MEDARVAELRKAVRHQLQQAGVQNVLHNLLQEYQRTGEVVTPDDALDILQGRGVIDQLVRVVRPPQPAVEALVQTSNVGPLKPPELPSGKAFLHVKVLGGRAFTAYAARAPPAPGAHPAQPQPQLQLCLELFGQRLDTATVAASVEPAFAGEAFFTLPLGTREPGAAGGVGGGGAGVSVDPLQLLALRQGLHAVVLQLTPMAAEDDDLPPATAPSGRPLDGPGEAAARAACRALSVRRAVVALGSAEWRTALVRRGKVVVSVQLGEGPGGHGGMPSAAAPAGLLTLQLELRPAFSSALDEALLKSQQRLEAARDADVMAAFVARAKAWWGDYVAPNLAFKARPVKVLATGEDGSQYPVCCFVRPLQLGRRLANPRQAARLVGLLRRREDEEAAAGTGLAGLPGARGGGLGEMAECWCCLHTVLASGAAVKEELALLLCGLLLGFGLDAWVVVGRLLDGSGHMWVMTRGPLAAPCFWEPGTGVRYTITDVDTWPYQSVGCVFNHQRLFANCQCDDSAFGTSYTLEDPALWRELPMPPEELPAMPWSAVPLSRSPLQSSADPRLAEAYLEAALRAAVEHHRRGLLGAGGATAWDEGLAHLLMPALDAYEHEAVHCEVAPGNEEFQSAVKRSVPLGWVFKAMPQHHPHVCVGLMRKALLEDEQMLDICGTTATTAAFALCVRVTPYAETQVSTWLMLAVKYSAVAPGGLGAGQGAATVTGRRLGSPGGG